MRRFASDVLLAKGISLDFEAPSYAPDIPLGANPRRAVFLIFKEVLANIVKHANATQVQIRFDFSPEYLTLSISDDGCGFDVDKLSTALFTDQKGGQGILSMKKRAAEMNGRLELNSEPGKGTTMTFKLSLNR
jgi:signal transduction histidine kinase